MAFSTLICPTCGESNPEEAVMCWACYTPLTASENEPAHKKKRLEITIHREWKDIFRFAMAWGALGAFIVAGYLPDYRVALLGTALGSIVVAIVWEVWERRNASRQKIVEENIEPTQRILDTILLYGVRDGASQIRLRAGMGVRVHYYINGEWQEQMRIPNYIWMALRSLIREKSDSWQRPVLFGLMSDRPPVECWPEFKSDPDYPVETVLLTLRQTLPPQPKPTA